MTRIRFRRKTVVLLLAAVLLFPWTASASPRPGSFRATEISASSLLDLLGRALGFLVGEGSKTGCNIDPSGLCAPGAPIPPEPTIRTDTGCNIDPDGRCRP